MQDNPKHIDNNIMSIFNLQILASPSLWSLLISPHPLSIRSSDTPFNHWIEEEKAEKSTTAS